MVVAYSAATKSCLTQPQGLDTLVYIGGSAVVYIIYLYRCVFEQELHVARYWEDNIP